LDKPSITILYDATEDEEQPKDADPPVYKEVAQVLKKRGYQIKTLAADANIRALVGHIEKDDSDIIFNLCESLAGKDQYAINVAALLELLGKRFTGTGSYGQMLAIDKALSKKIFSFHGIQYPKFSVMDAGQVEWSDELKFPLFVKPSNTDSSVGIDENALVKDIKQLMERISYIHTEIKSPVLIEEFIAGREIFVGVLGNERMEALPIIEWDFSRVKNGPKFATAEAKWVKDSEGYKAPEIFPQDIPEEVYKAIQATAVDACRALRIQDYGRVDMRLRHKKGAQKGSAAPGDWEWFIIEVNPNPYLEQNAEVAMAARKQELDYGDLVERIIELALRRNALRGEG
jgi:D-alanine-D-alanine ligase